tara:strand:+ start:1272 stop:1712 length:441 start_codon:yes stop_codon:yes gene_type:complete
MKLKFIFLGKKHPKHFSFLMEKYLKRLNMFVKSELFFFQEKNLNKLNQKISKHINAKSYLMILDEKGVQLDTLNYAKLIKKKMINYDSLIFIVGDAYGIPQILIDKSDSIISLSKMTLPHLVARLMLLEQMYRVFTVLNNHPYHHE